MAEFVRVAGTDEVPAGGARQVSVRGTVIALFHIDGAFYAIDDDCVHKGGPLAEGCLEGTIVACPWHGWKFDVRTGLSPVNPNARTRTYPVKVEGEDLLIEI